MIYQEQDLPRKSNREQYEPTMCTPCEKCSTILDQKKYRHAGMPSVLPPHSSSVELSMRALRTDLDDTDLVRCLQELTCAPSAHSFIQAYILSGVNVASSL